MNSYVKQWPLLALLMIAAFGLLFCSLFSYSWVLRARLNMALHGYIICQLAPPDYNALKLSFPRHKTISKVVLRKGTYVGYVDTYANFVPASETDVNWNINTKTTAVLFYGILVCSFSLCGLLIVWLHLACKGNRQRGGKAMESRLNS